MLNSQQKQQLLKVARESIRMGLEYGQTMLVNETDFDENLRQHQASFVTLYKFQKLRGCIGSISASRPLVTDISHNAYAAAFRDPRFSQITEAEMGPLTISISVLSVPTPILFNSEPGLLSQLQPGVDGLIIADGAAHATFLPSVWEQLPDKVEFLNQLKQKAGFTNDYWSDSIQISRYFTDSFEEANDSQVKSDR